MSKSLGKTDAFSLFTVPNTLQLRMDFFPISGFYARDV